MVSMMLKIGSHMDLKAPDYLLGAVKKTIENNANALMVYTGAPQNTIRKDVSLFKIDEAHALMDENHIDSNSLIIHAPYIINLGNCEKQETFDLAVRVLKDELQRVKKMGAKYLVLHPGSALKASHEESIAKIISGLNIAMKDNDGVIILLETMSGKGSEIGSSFEEIKAIIDGVEDKEHIAVCMDTCHINDAGYDLNDFDDVLCQFEALLPIELIKVVHINDSKNVRGARKDRHENIGYGTIGFDNLLHVIYHEKLENAVKILETPYINGEIAPYKAEIEMIRNKKYENIWLDIKENTY